MTRVALLLLIFLGIHDNLMAANVRITGLQSMTEKEALDFMGGRLTYIKARPATPSRADDVAFILENLLRKRGLNEADVSWSLPGNNTILLQVKEGPPLLLGEITLTGLDSQEEEIRTAVIEQFKAVHTKAGTLSKDAAYFENQNQVGLLKATQYLQSIGFWDAEVSLTTARVDPATGRMMVTLGAKPGPEYLLAAPTVMVAGQRETELESSLVSLHNQVASTENIRSARLFVENHYRGNGYEMATIGMDADYHEGLFTLSFDITPGERFTVGEVNVVGNEDVRVEKIINRFDGFQDQEFSAKKIEKEISRLYGTGAFESVRLETTPQDDETIDVTIRVEEGRPDGYFAYAGIGSLEGFILGGGYYHRNFLGNLWNFSTAFEWSGIGPLWDVRVTEPYFLDRDISFTARFYALRRDFDGYDKAEFGLGALASWKFENGYSGNLSFYSSYISTSADGVAEEDLGPTDYVLHRLAYEQIFDKRDNATVPTKGYYLRLNNALGFAFDDESVSYFRTDAKATFYQPIYEKAHLALNTQAGVIMPTGDSDELPIDLRYFIGGASTVRSFPERELGPTSNGDPRGGEAYWVANLEYIQNITGLLNGVVFLDAGNLVENFEDFGSGQTYYAAGLGVRVDLPIGPVRLEYGRNLNRGSGDPSGAFHFAIGTTF